MGDRLKLDQIQTNFSSGELSPRLFGRTDIAQYSTACAVVENMLVRPYGTIISTPGTEFVNDSKYTNPIITTNYWPACGSTNTPPDRTTYYPTSDDQNRQACYDCTITNMYVRVASTPGSSSIRKFTVLKNGEDTGLYISLTGSQTTGYASNSVEFGTTYFDKISIKEELTNTAPQSAFCLSLLAKTNTDRQVIVTGTRHDTQNIWLGVGWHPPILNNASLGVQNGFVSILTEATRFSSLFSGDGTLTNFRMLLDGPFNPTNTAAGLRLNVNRINGSFTGSTTGLDFIIYGSNLTGDSNSSTNTTMAITAGQFAAFVAAGYVIELDDVYEGFHTIDFIPSVSGERCFSVPFNVPSNSTRYCSPIGTAHVGLGAQNTVEQFIVCPAYGTIKNMYVNMGGYSPTSGSTITYTMRKNGVDTALAVTIANPSFSGTNLSSSFTVVPGDLLSLKGATNEIVQDQFGLSIAGPNVAWTYQVDNPLETPLFLSNWGEIASASPTSQSDRIYGRSRLLPFIFSRSDAYAIEAGETYFRFYTDGGVVES